MSCTGYWGSIRTFLVTWQVGEVDYEETGDRGAVTQINHVNLLKSWKDTTCVFNDIDIQKDELGPEVLQPTNSSFALLPDHISTAKRADIEAL